MRFGFASLSRSLSLAVVSTVTLSGTWAQTPTQDRQSEIARQLDDVLENALDQGLLERRVPRDEPQIVTPSEGVEKASVAASCVAAGLVDFAQINEAAKANDDEAVAEKSALDQMRIFIARGLYPEAISFYEASVSPELSALADIAQLMNGDDRAAGSLFEGMSVCDDSARFWHNYDAVISANQPDFTEIRDQIAIFRSLPFPLKLDVSVKLVPKLVLNDEQRLVQIFLSQISTGETETSFKLDYLEIYIETALNTAKDDAAVRKYLQYPTFRGDILAMLSSRRQSLSRAEGDELFDTFMEVCDDVCSDEERASRLTEFLTESSVSPSLQLLLERTSLPHFQGEHTPRALYDVIDAKLASQMAAGDTSDRLRAINALVTHTQLSQEGHVSKDTMDLAAASAIDLGLLHIVDLLRVDGPSNLLAATQSKYRRASYLVSVCDSTAADSRSDLDNKDDLFYELICAVETASENVSVDAKVADKLSPVHLVRLLERDAARAHWVLPIEFYDNGVALEDMELRKRAAAAKRLRYFANLDNFVRLEPDIEMIPRILNNSPDIRGNDLSDVK
ncbi:MAG: hypothetical protein ABNH53_02410 [Henriciella sp.]|jgi:hypothetical protein